MKLQRHRIEEMSRQLIQDTAHVEEVIRRQAHHVNEGVRAARRYARTSGNPVLTPNRITVGDTIDIMAIAIQ